ncbi:MULTISPECIES: YmaF family protein [Clostridium]|uniref:YmaF family protein n=1 Tax=Clostridium cibarium TaxID=2762247 RepID=A0ABR8PV63_9CLOT|nr:MULTISPECIES: YmaF family protein [Clostridium]MBD7912025.1 YmaF family protein [Clostridium cibarium]
MGYKENQYEHCSKDKNKCLIPNHNHEFLSSTDYARDDEGEIHNHRIAGVTGPAIRFGNSHVHKVEAFTDTFGDHFHRISDTTGPAIFLPGGKHIHLLEGETSFNDGHDHDYFFATLIENPSEVPESKKC